MDPCRRLRLCRKTRPWAAMFRTPVAAEAKTDDVKIGQLYQHHSTIVAAMSHYPSKRARALATVLSREHGLLVQWKALQTYILRAGLWTPAAPGVAPSVSIAASSSCPQSSAAIPDVTSCPQASAAIPDAKIGDLHAYRDSIVAAIRENPDKRAKVLASMLLDRYKVVRVQ